MALLLACSRKEKKHGCLIDRKELENCLKVLSDHAINIAKCPSKYAGSESIANYLKKKFKYLLGRDNGYNIYEFFWTTATLTLALEHCHRVLNNDIYLDKIECFYNKNIGNTGTVKQKLSVLDVTMNGYSLIYLEQNKKIAIYKSVIEEMIDYLLITHSMTKNGSYPYRASNKNLVLIDALAMVCPFLARYGALYGRPYTLDVAITQLVNFIDNGMDNLSSLPYHAFDCCNGQKMGIVGWGRGVGWLLVALVDTIEYIPKESLEYAYFRKVFVQLINIIVKYQDENGYYRWHLLDRTARIDTSATSMIGYATARAIDLGLIDNTYLDYACMAMRAIINSTNENGMVFDCLAECGGIGVYKQVYGHYVWGQGYSTAFAATLYKIVSR